MFIGKIDNFELYASHALVIVPIIIAEDFVRLSRVMQSTNLNNLIFCTHFRYFIIFVGYNIIFNRFPFSEIIFLYFSRLRFISTLKT